MANAAPPRDFAVTPPRSFLVIEQRQDGAVSAQHNDGSVFLAR
jgi:hypothetical protein